MADVVDTWSYGDQNTKDWLHDGDVERSAADIIDTAENVAALGEQITAAAAQAVLDVNSAGSEQMAAIEGVTASQVAIVEAAGTAQAAAVAAEGASQIAAIDGKASDVIDSIQETVQEQAMSLLEAAIEAQETSIANAGAAQVAAIDAEGAALVADAEAARDDAVSAKDAALASQAAAATAAENAAESEAAALAAADSASANASAAGVSAANAETAATQAAAAADAAMSVTDFDKYQHVNTKAWANTVDYSPGAIAKGSDGNLYVALQASGPSTVAVNPVGDASGTWRMNANQSDIKFLSNDLKFLKPQRIYTSFNYPFLMYADGNNDASQIYYYQSVCYDSKRDVFYLGIENAVDNHETGYIVITSDLSSPDYITQTVSGIDGGHFNGMVYDSLNDLVYIAPGEAGNYTKKLVIWDPSTKTVTGTISLGAISWRVAIDNDKHLLYVINGGSRIIRYDLSGGTPVLDTEFYVDIVAPSLASYESSTGQNMFYHDGAICLLYNIENSGGGSGAGWTRTVISCINVDTNVATQISFPEARFIEIEDATIKGDFLYFLGSGWPALSFYESEIKSINVGGLTYRALEKVHETDLNQLVSPGVYTFYAGTTLSAFANAPANVTFTPGRLVVEGDESGFCVKQTIYFRNGPTYVRQVQAMGNNPNSNAYNRIWDSWCNITPTATSSNRSSVSLANVLNGGFDIASRWSDPPVGSNGCVWNWIGTASSLKIIKQFFCCWGTVDSNDHKLYFRSIHIESYNSANPTKTISAWHKIITDKDSFPNNFLPSATNTYTLGTSSVRWKEAWLNAGAINTSDERIKDSIEDVPDAVLDAWEDVEWKQFQFKDAIAEKGKASARLHNGLIAQHIDAVFKAHNLDATRYGLFCWDEWQDKYDEDVVEDVPAVLDENGNEVEPAKTHIERKLITPAGDMYSLRYEEALCMEAAYQRRRADRAEARITELERRLDEMEAVLASLLAPVGDETYAGSEEGNA